MQLEKSFPARFKALTGHEPYPWQEKLYESLLNGVVPHRLSLPTAAGKTSLIPIWLCVIWQKLSEGVADIPVPRRLYFAVDRRMVVDQSDVVAQTILDNLKKTDLWGLLQQRTVFDPLVVSVLRGQRVIEYDDIVCDPSAFGVILCTPDMLFSRLLGGAYGTSYKVASREMGLVGQDAFVVLDEAHISEANVRVLDFVSKHNNAIRPFWWTTMSATLRQDADFTLDDDDLTVLAPKLNAHKHAEVVEGDLIKTVLATVEIHEHDWSRLIIYVERPADAVRLYNRLTSQFECLLLTGTMRGYEKSKLDFSAFKTAHNEKKHVLICTSAGEVGLDVSCDFLISEVACAERLAQRFGRCNRWAECDAAYVYVVKPPVKEKDDKTSQKQQAVAATLDYLAGLKSNVSTGNLYQNPIPASAFSPVPASRSLNAASLAQIANTTYQTLPVDKVIRGAGFEYHVNLVVRKDAELQRLIAAVEHQAEVDVRVSNNEVFKELPYIVVSKLNGLNKAYLFVNQQGDVTVQDKLNAGALTGGTLFLPESLNCVNALGMFDPTGGGEGDVFSKTQDKVSRFVQIASGFISLDTNDTFAAETVAALLKLLPLKAGFKKSVMQSVKGLVYVVDRQVSKSKKMTVEKHLNLAADQAENFTAVLHLDPDVTSAICDAALHHDDGKAHPLWQLAATGGVDATAWAKTGGSFHNPMLLGGMRHELVSSLWNPEMSPLAKWLTVSHHGRCRPQFSVKAYDPDAIEASAVLNAKLPTLLDWLNQEHGVWGLAYLEAVIRAVDIASE
jgi:CRISPR-associated endonuclease/helicase Cas3